MSKYNLTFWQWVSVPFIWLMWNSRPVSVRKTWHEVLKGMEPHKCEFTIREFEHGMIWWKCNHEGCNFVQSDDFKFKKGFFKS
jgi:hypothetical protein